MKQMKAIITILTLLSIQSEALPVTSKALDNNFDQLIWQTAWYSQHLNESKKETPFTGDSRKITAKSIFITPNFNQNTSHCPPGFKIDDNGKCIKVVNINQDDLLVTRLQSLFSQHETTDDTTSIDYDYSSEEDEGSQEPTHFTLPLVPILDDNDTSLYTINEPQSSTVQYEIELNEYSFRKPNDTDTSSAAPSTVVIDLLSQQGTDASGDEIINSTLIDLSTEEDERKSSAKPSVVHQNSTTLQQNETHVEDENVQSDEIDTTTVGSLTSIEQIDETESPESASTDSRDTLHFDEDDNDDTTTSSEIVINKSESFDDEKTEAEKTISNSSDTTAIHLDDYFDTILSNDSLLIDESTSYENATDFDYDVTTITVFSPAQLTSAEEESLNASSPVDSAENKTDVDEAIAFTANLELNPSTTTTESSRKVEGFAARDNDFPYENRIIRDDQQNSESEKVEASNKFVYHHLSATESLSNEGIKTVLATPSSFVRFPSQENEIARGQRVRFPDETSSRQPQTSTSFSWPRETSHRPAGIMRFWQEQPLINDFKLFSRGNSRVPSGNFNRHMSYRRNYK